jgi:hypothetical protein
MRKASIRSAPITRWWFDITERCRDTHSFAAVVSCGLPRFFDSRLRLLRLAVTAFSTRSHGVFDSQSRRFRLTVTAFSTHSHGVFDS